MSDLFFWIGVVLIGLGTLSVRYSEQRAGKEQRKDLQQRLETYRKEDISHRNEANEEQLAVWKRTMEKVISGEIPPPPDFVRKQEESILASAKDNEEWAQRLTGLRGEERNRLEAQHLALEARAVLLNAKLRPLFDNLVLSFRQQIDVLNKNNTFGGQIKCETFEVKGLLTVTHSELHPANMERVPVMQVLFPTGVKWDIVLPHRVIIASPNTEDTRLEMRIIGDNVEAQIEIVGDRYLFRSDRPIPSWFPTEIREMQDVGGADYLARVVKALFEREMKLAPSS